MNADCQQFRALLSEALSRGQIAGLGAERTKLGWHEHLVGCSSCRALLDAEEALDLLLGTLPQPELPAELAQRVLARLVADPLDALLDLDGRDAPAPQGLADRIVAGARLDALLEPAGQVILPVGLGDRVLAGLRRSGELEPAAAPAPRLRLLRGGRLRLAAAALAALGLGGLAWRSATEPAGPGSSLAEVDPGLLTPSAAGAGVDDELLASLDLLEQLELAESLDPVALDALVYLDVSDEIVVDWGEDWLDDGGGERR